jgi:hypothetical protein
VFAGGGDAGRIERAVDWSKTALGPVEGWSQTLRSTVALVLHNHWGMLLWWGSAIPRREIDAPGAPWPLREAVEAGRVVTVDALPEQLGAPPVSPWAQVAAAIRDARGAHEPPPHPRRRRQRRRRRESLAELRSALGHEVALAHDGPEALRTTETFKPDVFLLDIGLPAMGGYELARLLRVAAQLG